MLKTDLFEETKKEMSKDRHTRSITKKAVPENYKYKDDTGTKNDSSSASFGTQPCRYVSPR